MCGAQGHAAAFQCFGKFRKLFGTFPEILRKNLEDAACE